MPNCQSAECTNVTLDRGADMSAMVVSPREGRSSSWRSRAALPRADARVGHTREVRGAGSADAGRRESGDI
ncbi:hypothetical protein GCM10027569_79450 [Flindersiella endophytica]